MPTPYQPDDADQVLADFGEVLICAAVPSVTRGLIDDAAIDDQMGEATIGRQLTILKVKRGAFGSTRVTDTRVTVVSRGKVFSIDQQIAHGPSLFDWYALQPVRTT